MSLRPTPGALSKISESVRMTEVMGSAPKAPSGLGATGLMLYSLWYVFVGNSRGPNSHSLFPFCQALGNHEFDNGVEGLIDPLLKQAKFPILSANIKAKGPLASQISGLYLPYKILPVGDEVVGIVGYTSKETPVLSNPGIFYFYSTHWLQIHVLNQSLA